MRQEPFGPFPASRVVRPVRTKTPGPRTKTPTFGPRTKTPTCGPTHPDQDTHLRTETPTCVAARTNGPRTETPTSVAACCRKGQPTATPDPAQARTRAGRGLLTPPKCLTDRSPSFGVSLASTNTSETWGCNDRGRPVGRAKAGGVGRPAPSAARSPRDPRRAPRDRRVTPKAIPTQPRAIPWADLYLTRP
jgi:hypothetical protein